MGLPLSLVFVVFLLGFSIFSFFESYTPPSSSSHGPMQVIIHGNNAE